MANLFSRSVPRRRGENLAKVGLSRNDRALKENIKSLQESGEELEDISAHLRKILDLPSSKTRGFIAGTVQALVPKSFYGFIPEMVTKFVAEETDVLEQMEASLRGNVDSIQISLHSLTTEAKSKHERIEELKADLARAKEEGWDARQLQEYIAEKAGIELYEEIAEMLDREFGFLPEDEREKRKEELLVQLENNAAIGGQLMNTMGRVCIAGLQVFNKGVGQYYDFMNVYKPLAVIRDAAKDLVKMDESMFKARDALVETLYMSLKAVEASVDAAKLVGSYSIASADMHELLKQCGQHLGQKLKELEASSTKLIAAVPAD